MAVQKLTREEAAVLLKLYRKRKFGASHILEDSLLSGFPPDKLDVLKKAVESLKRDGIQRTKKSKQGDAVSIPPHMGMEIYEELMKRYAWLPPPPWLR